MGGCTCASDGLREASSVSECVICRVQTLISGLGICRKRGGGIGEREVGSRELELGWNLRNWGVRLASLVGVFESVGLLNRRIYGTCER